jgi:hypothetical protein
VSATYKKLLAACCVLVAGGILLFGGEPLAGRLLALLLVIPSLVFLGVFGALCFHTCKDLLAGSPQERRRLVLDGVMVALPLLALVIFLATRVL